MTTTTIPDTPTALREFLDKPQNVREAFENPEKAAAFMDAYAEKINKRDPDIKAQVREHMQVVAAEFFAKQAGDQGLKPKVNLAEKATQMMTARAQGLRSSAHQALWANHASGAEVDRQGVFADAAEFFAATNPSRKAKNAAQLSQRAKLQEIQNSYSSESPAAGGFLIPESMRSEILQVAIEESVTRSRATVIPMSTLRVKLPLIDDTSHVTSIFGGVKCYWTEEAGALIESQAKFGAVELDAKKLTGFALVPNELLDDAPAFTGFFNSTFPRAIAWTEDLAFTKGTGVGEPLGWLNCPGSVQVAAEPGQLSKTILWENILEMYSRLLPTSLGNAVWVANKDTFRQLMTMALPVGVGGSAIMIGQGLNQPGSAAPPMTILGIPVVLTEKVPSLGTTGDIALVDLSYYLIGDRQQMETANSEHYAFNTDKMAFRVIERVDGQPWLQSPITPNSGSANTLTAFVQLAGRP